MSTFDIAGRSFPAFSGIGKYVNKRAHVCLAHHGAIPPGRYFIVDRPIGGRLAPLRNRFGRRGEWFGLYADDGRIDDETFCNEVLRSNFRLHPKVGQGFSKGCITLESMADFNVIRHMLLNGPTAIIRGSELRAYGEVWVR